MVRYAAVGAAAHEDIVDRFAEQLFPGFESNVLQCLGVGLGRDLRIDGHAHAGVGAMQDKQFLPQDE